MRLKLSWVVASFLASFACFLHAAPVTLNKEWPVSKLVTIDASFLSVKIEGEDRKTIQANSTLENFGTDVTYEWITKEDQEELSLRLVVLNVPQYNIDGTITLRVPQGTSVRVNNSSGDVWVHQLKSREIAVKTASGDVTVQDCDGVVKVNTASGEINASRLKGTLKFRNVSGDLYLNNLQGSIFCRTASGQTEAYHLQGDVEVESGCGGISIEGLYGELAVETKSGPIKARNIRVVDELDLRSITGSITLSLAQPINDFSSQLNTETGTILVAKQSVGRKWRQEKSDAAKIKLNTISGSIQMDQL
jgi:DUF4097 and DUF4098 domain-containing protein YvlB